MPAPPQRKRRFLIAALLAVLVSTTACTGDDDNDATTSNPPTDQKAEVKAAYLAYWDMLERLSEAPNPNDPEISQRATGEARSDLVEGLDRLRHEGQRLSTGEKTGHTVSDIKVRNGKSALLRDCDVDDSSLLDKGGQVVDHGVTTTLWDVTLVKRDGDWSVASFDRVQAWNGEEDCK